MKLLLSSTVVVIALAKASSIKVKDAAGTYIKKIEEMGQFEESEADLESLSMSMSMSLSMSMLISDLTLAQLDVSSEEANAGEVSLRT